MAVMASPQQGGNAMAGARKLTGLVCAVVAAGWLVAGGCGGGGGGVGVGAGAGGQGVGAIAVTVVFPAAAPSDVGTADLPAATQSVVFYVYRATSANTGTSGTMVRGGDSAAPLVEPVVVRRQEGEERVTVTIESVPAGDCILRAEAYATANPPVDVAGSRADRARAAQIDPNTPIAEAEVPVKVRAGQTTAVQMTADPLPVAVRIFGPDALAVGGRVQYTATAFDADGRAVLGAQMQWQSDKPGVLEVVGPAGTCQALAPGVADLTATAVYRGRQWTATKAVKVAAPAALEVTPNRLQLDPGQTATLAAAVVDRRGNELAGLPVVWTSSNELVATVDEDGNVRAEHIGRADVGAVATTDGRVLFGSCEVRVGALPPGGRDIAGRVSSQAGTPLDMVRVLTTNGLHIWSAVTSSDGEYRLVSVAPGARVVTFSRPGYATLNIPLNVETAQAVPLNAVMNPYSPSPTRPPVIHANRPVVNQRLGDAVVTGRIDNLDTPEAVLIVNGWETLFGTEADGAFRATAILVPGTNTIQIRATNAAGSAITDRMEVEYRPPSELVYFRITLTWDRVSDKDLHVLDPNGEHCYYANQQIGTGWLDHDNISDPPGTPENFTCTNRVPGRYVVWVRPYSGPPANCQVRLLVTRGPQAPKVWEFGPELVADEDWFPFDLIVYGNGRVEPVPHLERGGIEVTTLDIRPK